MWNNQNARREFLRISGAGIAAVLPYHGAEAQISPAGANSSIHDVKMFGAAGDGKTIDTPAINRAIVAAAAAGGGTVRFPAGNYLCYSIRLKSNVALYLDQNAVIIAADTSSSGSGGFFKNTTDRAKARMSTPTVTQTRS